jgi:hypothetical protein
MGEYATRKSDHQEVKIGTCEDMFYLRYEDRGKVRQLPGSLNPATELDLRFRLPFPDEDSVRIGEYQDFNRGERLYAENDTDCRNLHIPDDDPGIIQLTHKSGLLLNVPCHHGQKLPEVAEGMQAFWNGKSYALVLSSIKNTAEGIKPVVRCRFCNNAWRFDWADVFPYVNGELKARLREYAEAETQVAA